MSQYKDHPSIVDSIKQMTKDGKKIEDIMRVTGMPAEVVLKHQRQTDDDKPKGKKGVLDKITEPD